MRLTCCQSIIERQTRSIRNFYYPDLSLPFRHFCRICGIRWQGMLQVEPYCYDRSTSGRAGQELTLSASARGPGQSRAGRLLRGMVAFGFGGTGLLDGGVPVSFSDGNPRGRRPCGLGLRRRPNRFGGCLRLVGAATSVGDLAARRGFLLGQNANSDSIMERRTALITLGDLIKFSIMHY